MSDTFTPTQSQPAKPLWRSLLKLARPKQWAKCGFVLIGPMYGYADGKTVEWLALVGAVLAFAFAASACYVVNDLRDREADRLHPRKKRRPIASGAVSVSVAMVFALVLGAMAAASVLLVPGDAKFALACAVLIYVVNVTAYSLKLKHVVILDVICLASGFVLRVVGGCLATGVQPSPWLLNCTFFLAMFLSFGKRLGERRTMDGSGTEAAAVRGVQSVYTDDLLRMSVVVTAVATLITYAGYVQDNAVRFDDSGTAASMASSATQRAGNTSQADSVPPVVTPNQRIDSPLASSEPQTAPSTDAVKSPTPRARASSRHFSPGLYLLWLTMLPATYGLLRCIVLLERGLYDDPTELAAGDRPFQAAVLLFGMMSVGMLFLK